MVEDGTHKGRLGQNQYYGITTFSRNLISDIVSRLMKEYVIMLQNGI